jgi:hypothetical protein
LGFANQRRGGTYTAEPGQRRAHLTGFAHTNTYLGCALWWGSCTGLRRGVHTLF